MSAETLAAFKAWRATPANAEAYQRVETLWRSSGSLSGDRDIQKLTGDTLRASRPSKGRARSRLIPVLAVLAPVVVATVALTLWLPTRGLHETQVGEFRSVRLEDGTQVRLDTDTRLKVRFDGGQRRYKSKSMDSSLNGVARYYQNDELVFDGAILEGAFDGSGLCRRHGTRTGGMEDETDGIGTGRHCRPGIAQPCDATHLDTGTGSSRHGQGGSVRKSGSSRV